MGAAIPENSPQTATPFGKYLLVKRLATGGMAELFLAQEPPSPELLVIKRILPYLTEEPEFVQMFLDEARIAAQLHHPNIVQVFGLGRINESIFIAMEYVEGVDLRRILAEETRFSASVPYAVAARICAQVAAGLDHAHNSKGVDGRPLGLIHRDVSPQNVMVAYNGQVKLVDFGIAKAEAFAERSKPGVIKGKFLYLSPEQVMQEKLDHRSDIFALGVMLYEITTGRSPFSRANTEGILFAIRSEHPSPPHLLRDGYPQELSRIVMKCLMKDRTQRYQRAAHVQADLEALLASGTMKQSQDVAAYVARLLGAEEERTQLHVPITGSRKAVSSLPPVVPVLPPPPSGLVARPSLRTNVHGQPPAVDPEGEEPRTEMARPQEMLAAAALGADEAEPTAVGPQPGGRAEQTSPLGRALRRFNEKVEEEDRDDESTTHERLGRLASGRRSAVLTRKPTPSVASLDRRRGPPVREAEDEDFGEEDPSVASALSVATLNERGPSRAVSAVGYGESTSESTSEVSGTHSLPLRQVEPDDDPDDDVSTTAGGGMGSYTQPLPAPSTGGRRRQMILAVLLMVVLGVGVAVAAWWITSTMATSRQEASSEAEETPPPETPADPSVAPESGTGRAAADAPVPEQGSSPAPSPGAQPNVAGSSESGQTGMGAPGSPGSSPNALEGEKNLQDPTLAVGVRVQFKAPARTQLWVGTASVKPNGFLSVLPGTLLVEFRCPNQAGTPKTKTFEVPAEPTKPVVFKLDKQDCAPRSRR
ncbi:serine/threonine-protein kinase [Cystobacter fuscus]|uniref:serine/threonine-protein kinase n=1 Tax=Cystobacter fuscus TaxID=43 RepID=UPI0022B7627C|nr:serine/threonine-protein kinase [Cystobacter fuscus]